MTKDSQSSQLMVLGLLGVIGVLMMLAATNIIPTPDESYHLPRWVLFICGLMFVLPVLASRFSKHPRTARYLIAAMLLCFGTIGAACGMLGESDKFSGGLPFLSHETNTRVARVMFIAGGVLLLVCSVACALGYGTVLGEPSQKDDYDGDVET